MTYLIRLDDGYDPKGADGKGHNRMAIIPLQPINRCILKPDSWQAAMDTLRGMAHYGIATAYECCTGRGECSSCPVANAKRDPWNPGWMIREDSQWHVWLLDINDREEGWGAFGYYWKSWTALFAAIEIPPLTRRVDEIGPYFVARDIK